MCVCVCVSVCEGLGVGVGVGERETGEPHAANAGVHLAMLNIGLRGFRV